MDGIINLKLEKINFNGRLNKLCQKGISQTSRKSNQDDKKATQRKYFSFVVVIFVKKENSDEYVNP